MSEATDLRKQADKLIAEAHELDRAESKKGKHYMVGENIQDGRPCVSGPFTFDEAKEVCDRVPRGVRFICEYGMPPP